MWGLCLKFGPESARHLGRNLPGIWAGFCQAFGPVSARNHDLREISRGPLLECRVFDIISLAKLKSYR